MTAVLAAVKAPDIDWAGLSPLLALLGGAIVVLFAGLLGPRFVRAQVVPALSIASFGAAIGCVLWQWEERASLIEGALRLDPLTLHHDARRLRRRHRHDAARLARRGHPRDRARRVLRAAAHVVRGHGRARRRRQPRLGLRRPRALVAAAVHPLRRAAAQRALARVRPEVPDHRVGRLGDAALRVRAALRGDGGDGLRQDRRGARQERPGGRRPRPDRRRDGDRRPCVQGVDGAVPPVDARRLRGRADARDRVHVRRDEDRRVRRDHPPLRHRADPRRATTGARSGSRSQ